MTTCLGRQLISSAQAKQFRKQLSIHVNRQRILTRQQVNLTNSEAVYQKNEFILRTFNSLKAFQERECFADFAPKEN